MLFAGLMLTSILVCGRVRKQAKRGEIPEALGAYARGLETSLIAFCIGGTFVSMQYSEMLWHYFALTMCLEAVAVKEAEAAKAKIERFNLDGTPSKE